MNTVLLKIEIVLQMTRYLKLYYDYSNIQRYIIIFHSAMSGGLCSLATTCDDVNFQIFMKKVLLTKRNQCQHFVARAQSRQWSEMFAR